METIGFIGLGNMGGAMAKAIAERRGERVNVYDVDAKQYERFKHTYINASPSIEALVQVSKYIVLTVKPQYYEVVAEQLKSRIKEEQVIVTVAPGFKTEQMSALLGGHIKVMRTMPNTPALIGEGVTAYCYNPKHLKEEEVNFITECFSAFGKSYCVDEKHMDAIVALTGSSPAYGYIFIEAMADAAVKMGLPRQMAYEMASLSIKGACSMVIETKDHPAVLKDAVTSPGGTTIAAVAKLEEMGFRHSVISAMEACYDRAKEMGQK